MITSIPIEQIAEQLIKQLSNLFLITTEEEDLVKTYMGGVLNRLELNFKQNPNKYYSRGGEVYFNPYQSAQYTIFLYYFSNMIYHQTENRFLADKLYYLNKVMNACDLYYEVELPAYFTLDHPVGSVMGRAKYGNGFSFGQNCTVGNNKGIYPQLGKNVRMCANTSIIGNCKIGDNVIIGANSGVKDEDIPDDSIIFGYSPNLIIKHKK